MPESFYVTTPIYYVNSSPHLGTFYTTVVADALTRYHRARGEDSFLLTGTDEHGAKIERLARERGIAPKAFADEVVATFKQTWERIGVRYDRFIRTTDADHRVAVEEMWRRMAAKGDIYLADYDGLYCVGCEGWKTEEDVVLVDGEKVCPLHPGKPVERVKEKNYFFKLSRYADQLLALYQRPGGFIRPESRRNEVAEFVRGGLRDLSVSRSTVKWAIPVPGDPQQTVYVWIDALTNYLTALGGPARVQGEPRSQALWAHSLHLIAKDILRFHAVYWPAMLMSADLPPPRGIFCHGYLTVKGQKISKSLPATRVDPNAIAAELGVDPLRYFVLREYTFGADGDFSYEALLQRYESDLGNDLGNLVNRTLSLARQLPDAPRLPAQPPRAANDPLHDEEVGLRTDALAAQAEAERAWADPAPSRALEATWAMVRRGNGYIDRTAPWKLAKAEQWNELRIVLGNACEIIRRSALMVAPAMPAASAEILRQLGRDEDVGKWPGGDWTGWPGATVSEPKPVFPRIEADRQPALIAKWTAGLEGDKPVAAASPPPPAEVTYEEFQKVDLRAAKVLAARRVPKTDKLLELSLDLGTEQRTVVSGIAGAYAPEALVGRTVLYLANLKPAKIRGVLSQGMILAGGDGEVLSLAGFDRDLPAGAKVR
jgi:methionyl-tRNA synthetase